MKSDDSGEWVNFKPGEQALRAYCDLCAFSADVRSVPALPKPARCVLATLIRLLQYFAFTGAIRRLTRYNSTSGRARSNSSFGTLASGCHFEDWSRVMPRSFRCGPISGSGAV